MDDKGNDKFVLVCKILITVCARELHILMLKLVEEGGLLGGETFNSWIQYIGIVTWTSCQESGV